MVLDPESNDQLVEALRSLQLAEWVLVIGIRVNWVLEAVSVEILNAERIVLLMLFHVKPVFLHFVIEIGIPLINVFHV